MKIFPLRPVSNLDKAITFLKILEGKNFPKDYEVQKGINTTSKKTTSTSIRLLQIAYNRLKNMF